MEDARLTDARSDVYSLGVVLYHSLAGRLPYDVDNKPLVEVGRVIRETPPRLIGKLDRRFRGDLEAVLEKALAKEPGERYQSVRAFAEDLRRFLARQPVRARRVGPAGWVWRWCRRNSRLAILSALALATLTISLFVAAALALVATRQASELERTALHLYSERERAVRQRDLAERRGETLIALNDRLQQSVVRLQHASMNATLLRADAHAAEDHALARSLLRDETLCPPALRGFAWRVAEQRTRRLIAKFQAHPGAVVWLAFSDDGRILATVGPEKVRLWRVNDGKLLESIQDHVGGDSQATLDSRGERVLVLRQDGGVYVWLRAEQRKIRLRYPQDGPATAIALAARNGWAAVGGADGTVSVWGPTLDRPIYRVKVAASRIAALRFDPEARECAAVSEQGEVVVCQANTGKVLERQRLPLGGLHTAQWGASLRYLAAGRRHGTLLLWDRQTAAVLQTVGDSGPMPDAALAGGPLRLITSRRNRIEAWAGGVCVGRLHQGGSNATRLAVSPSEKLLAAGCEDGSVWIYRADAPIPARSIPASQPTVVQLRFSPDGRLLASSGAAGKVLVHEVASGALRGEFEGHAPPIRDLAFCENGRKLISIDRTQTLRKWHVDAGRLEREFDSPGERLRALARAGERLVGAGGRGNLLVYSLADGNLLNRIPAHASPCTALAVTADRGRFATGDEEGWVGVWDGPTMRSIVQTRLHAMRVTALQFSPDGRWLVTAGYDAKLQVWNGETLAPIARLPLHTARVTAIDFAPDGKVLATGGLDGRVILWDVATWEPQLILQNEIPEVRALRFSPDGARLAVAGTLDRIEIWETFPDAD